MPNTDEAFHVFFVSDHTGLTAEVLGHSLLARFDALSVITSTRPFVDSVGRADALAQELAAREQPAKGRQAQARAELR